MILDFRWLMFNAKYLSIGLRKMEKEKNEIFELSFEFALGANINEAQAA